MSPVGAARLATIGALLATIGDLAMLYVGNSLRADLSLAPPPLPGFVLGVGCVIGVIGLSLYGVGYAATGALAGFDGRLGRLVRSAGRVIGIAGAAVHGYTGWLIQHGRESGAVAAAPLDAVAAGGPLLLSLWAITFVALLAASAGFIVLNVQRRGFLDPLTLVNPLFGTAAFVVLAQPSVLLQAFLLPAAPNLAHVLFFGVLWWRLRAQRASKRSAP